MEDTELAVKAGALWDEKEMALLAPERVDAELFHMWWPMVPVSIDDLEFPGMRDVLSVETMHLAAKAALKNSKPQLGRREESYKNDLVDVALMVWRNCEKRSKGQKAGAAGMRGKRPRRTIFFMKILEAAGMHIGEDRVNQLSADAGGRPRFKKKGRINYKAGRGSSQNNRPTTPSWA